ncbi:hypothetical protein PRIPAC_71167 [Pristionchus pacificus]|uniref:Uncharacterized protein n=1 Tax=Pristionchus pacificus TaxID=54126 RepID=A0A2A6CFW6_PRIPA|nr:hypothetical protein PRIPAC_71167 [Pristionchus pacificus]|eukprot:PDM76977.1 hypothetical protein PRIPAC_42372 [Pristionchus pacificus]
MEPGAAPHPDQVHSIEVEPLITTLGPQPLIPAPAPIVQLSTTAKEPISMRPRKLRVRKVKTTPSPFLDSPQAPCIPCNTPSISVSTSEPCPTGENATDCPCDCAEAAVNGTDERITQKKGPKFYLTINGKSPNGRRGLAKRQCCCGGCGRRCCGCGGGCCCCGGGGGGGGGGFINTCMNNTSILCNNNNNNNCCILAVPCLTCCCFIRGGWSIPDAKKGVAQDQAAAVNLTATIIATAITTTAAAVILTKVDAAIRQPLQILTAATTNLTADADVRVKAAAAAEAAGADAAVDVGAADAACLAAICSPGRACAARNGASSEAAAAAVRVASEFYLRCCPYCNFCCNGMRTTAAGTGRKKREAAAAATTPAAPATPAAAASATSARPPAARKMLADTQRAFVKREKRQNRNRESSQCPLCPCNWCARPSANRDRHSSSYREKQREPADYARSGAPSVQYPRGGEGGEAPPRDADYPYADERRPRFRSYATARPPPRHGGSPYPAQPERDPEGFNPRVRMPQGGPVRGSGPFARALQMSSPFPWMRNWLSDQMRLRHRILGYDAY